MLLKFAVGIVAFVALATGGYFIVKENGIRTLGETLSRNLDSGDYLAALAIAGKMKGGGTATPELEATIAKTARLLVAEDIYHQAVKAGNEERWVDARALLVGSEAVSNPSFKYYEEAKRLLQETEALAAGVAHKTAVTISTLEEKAKTEQGKRRELEQNKKKLESTLSEKEKTLLQSKAETAEANRKANLSQKDAEAKQAELVAEQARAKALMEQVERESKQKFLFEFKTYRDLAQRGKEQLDNAAIEISAKRDPAALIYVNQGRNFFEEAKAKTAELKSSRTPTAYQGQVDALLSALGDFLEASKQFRSAVFLIDDQGSAAFTESFSKGKAALSNAVSLLLGVSSFLAGQ